MPGKPPDFLPVGFGEWPRFSNLRFTRILIGKFYNRVVGARVILEPEGLALIEDRSFVTSVVKMTKVGAAEPAW